MPNTTPILSILRAVERSSASGGLIQDREEGDVRSQSMSSRFSESFVFAAVLLLEGLDSEIAAERSPMGTSF